ncbi:retinol dehydrogenase 13-like [Zerene cesonia]|uniref:retinol dehydrogenase 13-like n=1 Tax=Zerene cesonia TaxID=33412 RepID=UPI0018E59F46|nr:retinol dehydrogenase 13-like [Zerene cesonia]XP_038206575.1 retinol dehydrogenase 13-like [Zerene cesonia]
MWTPNLPVTIITGVAAGAGFISLFKDFYGGKPYIKEASAEGKTIIVTGATSGIGKETTWELAKRGAKVFMACRDMAKCEEVRRSIVLETGNKYVYCRPCDLADNASIRKFVETFKSEEPRVDVLVNNAAVMEPPQGVTRDGYETQLGVNHMGHFLLTQLLMDTLKASVPSRVIVVTCVAHTRGDINKQDLNFSKKYDAAAAYNQSKLANALFARELGRRLLETDIAVIAVDPGFSDTELSRHLPMRKSMTRFVVYPLFWPVMKKPRVAAQTILHAALEPALQKCKGDYFVDMKPAEFSEKAQDYELAQWFWKVSERWTRLYEHKADLEKAMAA